MPQGKKRASASEKDQQPKGTARPEAAARTWRAVHKLQGGGRKFDARQKLPSGPLGGAGRKTNLTRSS